MFEKSTYNCKCFRVKYLIIFQKMFMNMLFAGSSNEKITSKFACTSINY